MIEKNFKKGEVLLRQGAIWDNMYQIKKGSVGFPILKSEVFVGDLKTGEKV